MQEDEITHFAERQFSVRRVTCIVTGLMLIVAMAVPFAVHHTVFRNMVLTQALQIDGLTAKAVRSTGGWFTSFEFHDVVISGLSAHVNCSIESLNSGRSMLGHLFSGGPLTITLTRPRVAVELDDAGQLSPDARLTTAPEDIVFRIRNGQFTLRVPWRALPIVDLDRLDMQGTVAHESDGQWLTIDRIMILDHAQLTDVDTAQNLALVAPVISQTTSLTGTVSAQLNGVRVCLNDETALNQDLLRGTVQIHSLEATLREDWSKNIARLVGVLNHSQTPPQMKLTGGSTIAFRVTDEGIHHTGFSVVLPNIASGLEVTSSGVLRLDEQIELAIGVQVPLPATSQSLLLRSLAGIVSAPLLQLRVTGTVSEPKIATPDGRPLVAESIENSVPGQPDVHSNSTANSVRRQARAGMDNAKPSQQ